MRLTPLLARHLNGLGIKVKMLRGAYIRAYVKFNNTDAADACALLEAARCADIAPIKIKLVDQQALQGLTTFPHYLTLTTFPAAICLPLGSISAIVAQIPCRHGPQWSSHQMPDSQLQAYSACQKYRSVFCTLEEVHIQIVRSMPHRSDGGKKMNIMKGDSANLLDSLIEASRFNRSRSKTFQER